MATNLPVWAFKGVDRAGAVRTRSASRRSARRRVLHLESLEGRRMLAVAPPVIELGVGISDGATPTEMTQSSGLLLVQAAQNSSVKVQLYSAASVGTTLVEKTYTGLGSTRIPVQLNAGEFTRLHGGQDGIRHAVVWVTDAANASAYDFVSFAIDTTRPPAAAVITLGQGIADGATAAEVTQSSGLLLVQAAQNSSVKLQLYAAASISSTLVEKTYAGLGSTPIAVQLSPAELTTLRGGQDGVRYASVWVTDAAGKSANSFVAFEIDTQAPAPPVLTLGAGVAGGATQAEATQLSGVVTIAGEPGLPVTVRFENEAKRVITKTLLQPGPVVLTAGEISTLGDGLINVTATQKDRAGNESQPGIQRFTIDTQLSKPVISLGAGVADGATLAEATQASGLLQVTADVGSIVTVQFVRVLNGSHSELARKQLTGSGSSTPVAVRLTDAEARSLGIGTLYVSVWSTDSAGNSDFSTQWFTMVNSWTILYYATGDNLNSFIHANINQMERFLAGFSPNSGVSIVVAWDQPDIPLQPGIPVQPAFPTAGGQQAAWRTYGRSVLRADTNMSLVASVFDVMAEQNTGRPETLADFITWGAQQAPAENYALQFSGHGAGLSGSQFDYDQIEPPFIIQVKDPLTSDEVAGVLGTVGMPAMKLVAYDNCYMAMAEVGYTVSRSFSGHFVASEELIGGTGQDYVNAYSALLFSPATKTSADLARSMIASYGLQYANSQLDTLSAVTTTGYDGLALRLRDFVTQTNSLTANQMTTIRNLVINNPNLSVDGGVPEYVAYRDLGRFMNLVVGAGAALPQNVRTAASQVAAAVAAMVTNRTNDSLSNSGISIYLPAVRDGLFNSYRDSASRFCDATNWDVFIARLAPATTRVVAATTSPAPQISAASVGARGFAMASASKAGIDWATVAAAEATDVRGRSRPVVVQQARIA